MLTNTARDKVTIFVDFAQRRYSEPLGKSPQGIAYDTQNPLEYVANFGSNNVSILMDRGPYYTLSGFDGPCDVAWDQSTLTIWATNDGNGKAYEIGGDLGLSFLILKKYSTASDFHALWLAYHESSDKMDVTGFDTKVVYVL